MKEFLCNSFQSGQQENTLKMQLWCTSCATDHEAGLNFLDLLGVHVGKVDPHSFCLAMKIGFNIVDK
jgi:hypothetical protein